MILDRLRELDTAASPGPWGRRHGVYDVWAGDGRWGNILHATAQHDMGSGEVSPPLDEQAKERVANARLAALSHLLLPMAEALEKVACPHQQWFISQGVKHVTHEATCTSDKACRTPCARCAVLAQLEEALR